MKTTLAIAKGLALPLAAVTEKLAWLGVTGSGKTYGATKFAELLWHAGAQFVALDPVGTWYGLRLAKDGKSPSDITVPVFGGLHGDVPIEPTGGALLADLIVDRTLSCIIDVSQFESDADKARFAQAFIARLFFRKKAAPSALHLFIEECQEFVPQNPQRGEERMLHEFIRTQKLGRNFGIGSSYISQRPQEVNKKALNMAQTLFAFRTTGTHERKAIAEWMADKSLKQDLANDLPKLATGSCHLWSPEFLKMSETARILEKTTFNASATPEVGAAAKVRTLAPIDLEKVRTDMAATIERAKLDDPALLRKRIAELERAANKAKPTAAPAIDKTKLKAEYDRGHREGTKGAKVALRRVLTSLHVRAIQLHRDATSNVSGSERLMQDLEGALNLDIPPDGNGTAPRTITVTKLPLPSPEIKRTAAQAVAEQIDREITDGAITGPEQRILDGIAWMEGVGVDEPQQAAVAFLARYSGSSNGAYKNPRAKLAQKGLVRYASGDRIALTDDGRALAVGPPRAGNATQLHEIVCAKLPGPEQKILRQLLHEFPEGMSNAQLAVGAGYSDQHNGAYKNPRARLRTFGLIEYQSGDMVRASEFLFPTDR